jgi:hypothetical protein
MIKQGAAMMKKGCGVSSTEDPESINAPSRQ